MAAAPIQQYLVLGVMVISLWATITDFVPVSVSFVLLLPFVPYALSENPTVPRCITALLGLYAYFFLSTLLYAPSSFVEPEFYRRDGNFFPTMMPLLLGSILSVRINVERVMRAFLKWVTVWNSAFLCVFFGTGGSILIKEPGLYHFLFIAHNAAGGFLAMVVALSMGLLVGRRWSFVTVAIVAINMFALILTKSRGSMFGLIVALLVVFVLHEKFLKTIAACIAAATAFVLSITYPAWLMLGMPPGMGWVAGRPFAAVQGSVVNATFLDRVLFLWPRAVYLFIKSPIFGTGFGSYNDLPYRLVGIPHVLMYNRPYMELFNSAHAHNTFLHVLAETGLVGLGLLLFFLVHLWRYIDKLGNSSVRTGMKTAFWVAVFTSLTEHRLFTPAEMLPVTILLGIALAGRGVAAEIPPRIVRTI